ncbi:hypothetical protein FACS1894152_6000 [Bacilli bacterium]|nr:hypothetical protein FACS1894152_6000 [Bacilli bacterium]
MAETAIKLFENKNVRMAWDDTKEKWYFSVIDIIEVLTGGSRPRKYWNALKTRLKAEGSQLSQKLGQLKFEDSNSQLVTNCNQLKLQSSDGK